MRRTASSNPAKAWTGTIRLLSKDDWPLIEALFGANGACGGCWCMYWRVARHGKQWEAIKGEPNRHAFSRLVAEGRVHGVLAVSDGTPVGWCCFGPRGDFPRLLKSRNLQRPEAGQQWSVVCFFVRRAFRRCGLGVSLLQAATDAATAHGVAEIEGYPKQVRADSSLPGSFIWTGTEAMFLAAGYRKVPREQGLPPIYVFSHERRDRVR
jgi:GNAT superfamily N-acetyltransferase